MIRDRLVDLAPSFFQVASPGMADREVDAGRSEMGVDLEGLVDRVACLLALALALTQARQMPESIRGRLPVQMVFEEIDGDLGPSVVVEECGELEDQGLVRQSFRLDRPNLPDGLEGLVDLVEIELGDGFELEIVSTLRRTLEQILDQR